MPGKSTDLILDHTEKTLMVFDAQRNDTFEQFIQVLFEVA